MYIVEMIDSWDRTVKSWCVECSKEEVENFVDTLNKGLSDELENKAESNEQYYFYYHEVKLSKLPSEEELIELMKPSEFELSMREQPSNSGLTLEMIRDWEISNVTDFSGMFKDCK